MKYINSETFYHMVNIAIFTLGRIWCDQNQEEVKEKALEYVQQYFDLMGLEVDDDEEEIDIFFSDDSNEIGYDPYLGCITDDC